MNRLYTGNSIKAAISTIVGVLLIFSFVSIPVYGLPTLVQFDADPGMVISDQDFYSLPLSFSTPEKIQQYLVGKGSFLANKSFVVSLEPDSAVLTSAAFAPRPIQYSTPAQLGPYLGQTMSAAQIIWHLTRTNMSSSCSMFTSGGIWYTNEVCYDGAAYPINPGFLISMIQKESGLIFGANAGLDPNSAQAQFLLDRVVGYYCFEDPNRANSCYDENPNWKYYKGFFRQLYFAVRLLRLREQMCRIGGPYTFSNYMGNFAVGKFVWVSGRQFMLRNGISCSMYIYTPHISSQRLALQIMLQLQIDRNLIEIKGLPPEYIPARLISFSEEGESPEQEEELVDNVIEPDPESFDKEENQNAEGE